MTNEQLTPYETAKKIYKHVVRYDPKFDQKIVITDSNATSNELYRMMHPNERVYLFYNVPCVLRSDMFVADYVESCKDP